MCLPNTEADVLLCPFSPAVLGAEWGEAFRKGAGTSVGSARRGGYTWAYASLVRGGHGPPDSWDVALSCKTIRGAP